MFNKIIKYWHIKHMYNLFNGTGLGEVSCDSTQKEECDDRTYEMTFTDD
jgi:hypothetical protein